MGGGSGGESVGDHFVLCFYIFPIDFVLFSKFCYIL